jgi:parallel beta-helix repeat protein/predicted outer membrane repeat protein
VPIKTRIRRRWEQNGRRWPLALALVLLVHAAAWGQTRVAGVIDRTTTWTASRSPYVLEGEVEVLRGATLTILAGVRVEFEPGSRLLVGGEDPADTGRLLVAGSPSALVVFAPARPGVPSGAVELRPGAAWDADGAGSAFRFVRFDSVHQPLTTRGAAATLEDVTVLRATDPQRPAVVVELDPETDTALRATRVRVFESAGGGMSIVGRGNHELIECRFLRNAGRGLHMDLYGDPYGPPRPATEVRVVRCDFIENTASKDDQNGYGGGALLGGSGFTIEGCTFENNTSDRDGGGLYLAGGSDTTLRSCVFTGNTSGFDGGGLQIAMYDITIEDCRFSGNSARSDGGGIDADQYAELRRCVFEGNEARWGGATQGQITAIDCEFVDNFARETGGAMLVRYYTRNFGVRGGVFRGNRADGSGGAIDFTYSYTDEEVRIEGAAFIENRAELGGAIGGIGGRPSGGGPRLTLVGNHFEANLARRGGALHVLPDALAGLRLNLSAEGDTINSFRANLAATGPAVANDSEQGVEARGVCWGLATSAAIGTLIHDGLDDPALGVVAIDPIATGCLACPADLDGDGALTIFDFLLAQGLFAIGDPAADFDGDGALTIFDFLAFQSAFEAGCP